MKALVFLPCWGQHCERCEHEAWRTFGVLLQEKCFSKPRARNSAFRNTAYTSLSSMFRVYRLDGLWYLFEQGHFLLQL